jgi:hypothetical protein
MRSAPPQIERRTGNRVTNEKCLRACAQLVTALFSSYLIVHT